MHSADRVSGPKTVRTKQEVRIATECSGLNTLLCWHSGHGENQRSRNSKEEKEKILKVEAMWRLEKELERIN